jgi:hypothetical protein
MQRRASSDRWIRQFQQYGPRRTSFPQLNRDSHLVMRGNGLQQAEVWSYISPEERLGLGALAVGAMLFQSLSECADYK